MAAVLLVLMALCLRLSTRRSKPVCAASRRERHQTLPLLGLWLAVLTRASRSHGRSSTAACADSSSRVGGLPPRVQCACVTISASDDRLSYALSGVTLLCRGCQCPCWR